MKRMMLLLILVRGSREEVLCVMEREGEVDKGGRGTVGR